MEQSTREEIVFHATDGQRLEATWIPAVGRSAEAMCLIGPALGVPRRFYDDLAIFLSVRGFDVLSVDFRGFGGSAKAPLYFDRGFESFGLDLNAAIEETGRRSRQRLVYIGHSVGAVALGYATKNNAIDRAFAVASGSGYHGWSPFPENALRFVFWNAFVPAITRTAGYYPGKSIGILGDIPSPIMTAWAKMCRNRDFFPINGMKQADLPFANFRGDLAVISFDDDRIMPSAATDELARQYTNAHVTRLRLAPADIGLSRVGHIRGMKKGQGVLWLAMARWLNGGDWRLAG